MTNAPELEKQEEITNPTPTPEGGKVVANETVPAAGEDVDYKTSYEETAKKYSESSREAQRLNEIARAQEAKILKYAMKSRETFIEYLDEKELSPEQRETALKLYDEQEAQKAKAKENPTQDVPQQGKEKEVETQLPTIDPYTKRALDRLAEEEKRKDEERQSITDEFFSKEENKNLPDWKLDAIAKLVSRYDYEEGLAPREAFNKAVEEVLGKERMLEAKNNENYIDGIKDALLGGVMSAAPTSNSSKSGYSLAGLPKEDRAFVEAYIQNKGLNSEQAQDYIRRYTERLNSNN